MQSMEEIYQEYSNTVYKYLVCLSRRSRVGGRFDAGDVCHCCQENSSVSWRMQSIDLVVPDCQTFVV